MLILYSTETAEVDICNRKIRDDSDLHINGITTNMKYEKKTCKILQKASIDFNNRPHSVRADRRSIGTFLENSG